MLDSVTTGLTTVIQWIGSVVTALTTSTGGLNSLLPLFTIGISISVFMLALKAIRRTTWGS